MTKKQNKIIKIFLVFSLFFLCLHKNSFAAPSRNMVVFAEPNMAIPLTKIARLFSQKFNVIVSLNLNPASDLLNDVDSGEPADLFISAHSKFLGALREKGVVDVHNFAYVAHDDMVLVTLASNENVLLALQKKSTEKKLSLEQALKILDKNRAALLIDNVNNSSGKFSQSLLTQLRLSNLKVFRKLAEDKSAILSLMKNDKNSYALLLASQVFNKKDLQILAEKKDVNIFYEALVIAGDNMEVAREFLKFMQSDLAKQILQENGFATE
jgi:molybdate transport system substrate-binding protein